MSLARRKKILELSSEFGIPIVEDDPYSLTSFNGEVNPTLKSMDQNGNVLYVSSLSKIVASGLRIGWVIGPTRVIERLADAKQQVDFGHSVFTQWVANQFLESDDFHAHITMLRRQLKERRDVLIRKLEEILGDQVEFFVPEGGIHLWCKVQGTFDEYHLLGESIRNGVAFVPGSVLGTKSEYIRFTFGRVNAEQIQLGMTRFAETLNEIS